MQKDVKHEGDWSLQLLRTLGLALLLLLVWWVLAFSLLGEEGSATEWTQATFDLRWGLFQLIGFPSNWLINRMPFLQVETVAFPLIAFNMILHACWIDWALRWRRTHRIARKL